MSWLQDDQDGGDSADHQDECGIPVLLLLQPPHQPLEPGQHPAESRAGLEWVPLPGCVLLMFVLAMRMPMGVAAVVVAGVAA